MRVSNHHYDRLSIWSTPTSSKTSIALIRHLAAHQTTSLFTHEIRIRFRRVART